MSRQTDLAQHITDTYTLILEHEHILQTSSRPGERLDSRRKLDELRALAQRYLDDYHAITGAFPDDLAAIAAHIAAPPPAPPDLDDLIRPPAGDQVQGDKVLGDKVLGDKITYQVAAAPRLPLQRPARAAHFTDRQRELRQLVADLRPGEVVTLCGPGGIGKSALAAEAIWTLAPADEPPRRVPHQAGDSGNL